MLLYLSLLSAVEAWSRALRAVLCKFEVSLRELRRRFSPVPLDALLMEDNMKVGWGEAVKGQSLDSTGGKIDQNRPENDQESTTKRPKKGQENGDVWSILVDFGRFWWLLVVFGR